LIQIKKARTIRTNCGRNGQILSGEKKLSEQVNPMAPHQRAISTSVSLGWVMKKGSDEGRHGGGATCISKPWVIIPMVITAVQDYIAAGQFRGGEQLVDVQNATRPGTILVFLEPLYKGGLQGVTPGSSCIVNAYTSNHETISATETSTVQRIVLHVIDGVGLVHALLLRIQALLLPIKTLVLSGH
jgi:hypothetical protein